MDTISLAQALPGDVAARLCDGRAVIIPTETVYGLAIQPGNRDAARRVLSLKGRPPDLNLPVIIGSVDQLRGLGVAFNEIARSLAGRFWPGPLTLVLGFDPALVRASWLEGRVEVAVRLPGMKFLRDVALEMGPFLVTSANAHGRGATATAAEALDSLSGDVDLVVDGGVLSSMPSTIVNTRPVPAKVERVGAIGLETLRGAIGSASIVREEHA